MDKREFLSALEKSLSVLEEDELRDIVSEYEQHIDIKVAKGLTEEEAIADFGSFSELTAELLEAYHVRADYAAGGEKKAGGEAPGREQGEGEKRYALHALRDGIKGAGMWILGGARWTARQIVRPFSWLWGKCRAWGEVLRGRGDPGTGMDSRTGDDGEFRDKVSWGAGSDGMERGSMGSGGIFPRFRRLFLLNGREGRETERGTRRETQGRIPRRKKGEMIAYSIGKGIGRIFRWMTDGARFVLRVIWNGCWLLFSVIMGGFGLFCLYGLGVLAVLLNQGYPLAGVTLGCLGLVMCTFSACVMGFTFLKKRRRDVWENRSFRVSGKGTGRTDEKETGKDTGRMDRKETGKGTGRTGREEAAEDTGRMDSRRKRMKRHDERGGENTWVNCEV